jgi:hypothetical protein
MPRGALKHALSHHPNIGHKLILLSPLSCRRISWHGNAFSRYLCLTLLSLIIRELNLASVNLSLSAFYLASLITQDLSRETRKLSLN